MKITRRKLKLAWKYRGLLWRYRGLIRNRRPLVAAVAAAGTLLVAGALAKRVQRA
jgi:hypothetical protein